MFSIAALKAALAGLVLQVPGVCIGEVDKVMVAAEIAEQFDRETSEERRVLLMPAVQQAGREAQCFKTPTPVPVLIVDVHGYSPNGDVLVVEVVSQSGVPARFLGSADQLEEIAGLEEEEALLE